MTAPGPFITTGVGSLPHTDPASALRVILAHFTEAPYWPQLPRRSHLENMYTQYAAGLPGAFFEGEKLLVESGEAMMAAAEPFYERYLTGETSSFSIPPERAAGLYELLARARGPYAVAKGQVTGPVSFGLMVTDRGKKPLFYDPVGRDVLVKFLARTARWQAERLGTLSPRVVLVLDEPYLASVGSAMVSLSREEVTAVLDEILEAIPGVQGGVHCCANTDWGLVLGTRIRYLSFDAYGYADAVLLYPEAVSSFLARGGSLAFGIVPTSEAALAQETAQTLASRLERILARMEERGIGREEAIRDSFVTPACGLGTLPEKTAEKAISLSAEVSRILRGRYGKALP